MAADKLVLVLLVLACSRVALAFDPHPLQDFCVRDMTSKVFVNGFVCKDPSTVTPDDFFYSGLNVPRNVSNQIGSNVTTINVNIIPGLNTLGITLIRIDFAPNGVNAPHSHPRATEILTVIKGTLMVGFVTSNTIEGAANKLYAKTLKEGDVYVFPQGLIHFEMNLENTPAVAMVAQNSQMSGVVPLANSAFGSLPAISDAILAKSFRIDNQTVQMIKAKFTQGDNNY